MVKANAKPEQKPRGWLIWIVSGLGLLVIAGSILVVTVDAMHSAAPADFQISEVGRTVRSETTAIEIEVRNIGGEAAVAVEVEGVAQSGVTGGTTLDYVAGQSTRRATLSFPGDPGQVEVSVRGWTEP